MCPLRGGGESCGPNRQHIVIAEACPFNTGEALINLRREPEISTSGTGWERLTLDSDAGLLQLFIGTEFMRLTPLFAAIRRGAVLLLRAESV